MKKAVFLLLVLLTVLVCLPASAQVERSGLLDTAFSMLEKGNIFITRYNDLTGANVEAAFELGMPYFFGGKYPEQIFMNYPDYSTRDCWETTHYYRKGKKYIFGFDCAGYTNWIFTENGMKEHDSLSNLVLMYGEYGDNHIFSHRKGKESPPAVELHNYLKVGDLLVTKHRSRHVMMYIGTLRDFNFTAEEVPQLADYLDYPLVVHCGPHPDFGERFQAVIDQNPDRFKKCITTNGGVCVSIVGVPYDAAPNFEHVQVNDFYWFELEGGQKLTLVDYDQATSFAWYRHDPLMN